MNIWNRISYLGVEKENNSDKQSRRLILFNQVLFIGFFATLFQIISCWTFIGYQSFYFLIISGSILISLILNSKGHFWFSLRFFMLIVYATGSFTTTLLGGAGLYHVGALSIFASGLILFDVIEEKLEILLGIPMVALSILIGELGWFNAPDFSGHAAIQYVRFGNIMSLLVVNTVITIFIIRLNNKNEQLLFNHKTNLEGLIDKRTKELQEQKDELESQNKEKEILLSEVHHRVKNNLQIIVSLLNLQISKFDEERITKALTEARNRVLSMSLVHQKMYQNKNFSDIKLLNYTNNLISNIGELYDHKSIDMPVLIDESLVIDLEKAIPYGLIINEIITNYFKHTDFTRCKFEVSLVQVDDDFLKFKYKDDGPGYTDLNIDGESSVGLGLIESLVEQLDGHFNIANDNGAICEFTMKIN